MLNELITRYGEEVDNSIDQLSGLITQQKILKNTEYALQTQIAEQTDLIVENLNNSSDFDTLDVSFSHQVEVSVLDSGSNELGSYSLCTVPELKEIYESYLTGISKPDSDLESDWEDYYNNVADGLQVYKENWLNTYDSVYKRECKYSNFTNHLFEGLVRENTSKVINDTISYITDEPILIKLDYINKNNVFNATQDSRYGLVNNMRELCTQLTNQLQLKNEIENWLGHYLCEQEPYEYLGSLIQRIEDEELRNQFVEVYVTLKNSPLIAKIDNLIHKLIENKGIDSQCALMDIYELLSLVGNAKGDYITYEYWSGSHEIDDQIIDLLLSLLSNQYKREKAYNGIMNLDMSSSDSNRSTADLLTRNFIDVEEYDWDSEVGISLIKDKINNRIKDEAKRDNLLSWIDVIQGNVSNDLVNCSILDIESETGLKAQIEDALKRNLNFDSELQRQEALETLLDDSGNSSLANDVYEEIQNIGTENDPIFSYLGDLKEYFESLGIVIPSEEIEAKFQQIVDKFVGLEDKSDVEKLIVPLILERYFTSGVTQYQRDYEMKKIYKLLVLQEYQEPYNRFLNLLDSYVYGNVNRYSKELFDITQYFPENLRETILNDLQVIVPFGEADYDYDSLYDELLEILMNSDLSSEDIEAIEHDLQYLKKESLLSSDAYKYKKEIVTIISKISLPVNLQRSFQIAHILVGDCMSDDMINNVRENLANLTLLYSTDKPKVESILDFLADHQVYGFVQETLLYELQLFIGAFYTQPSISRCNQLLSTILEEDSRYRKALMVSEIIGFFYHNDDNSYDSGNSFMTWVLCTLTKVLDPGLSTELRDLYINELNRIIDQSSIPDDIKSEISESVNVLVENRYSDEHYESIRDSLGNLIPLNQIDDVDSLYSDMYEYRIECLSIENQDFKSNSLSALDSIILENRDRMQATIDKYSASVNNMAPTIRVQNVAGNSITIISVSNNPANSGNYSSYYPGKYALFGGDRIIDAVRRLRSPNSAYNKVFNEIHQKIDGVRRQIYSISNDIRSSIGINKIKNSIVSKAGEISQKLQEILCLLDFLHDLIAEINKVIADFEKGLRDIISDLNMLIDDLISEILRLFRLLSNLGNISIGAYCTCMSFNFSVGIDLTPLIPNWLCSFGLSIPNPFLNLYGPFINPNFGCPQYLLDELSHAVNPNGTTKLAGRGYQTNANFDDIFKETSNVRIR